MKSSLKQLESMVIKRITAEQAYPLRQAILRPDGTLQDCMFDGDESATTHHYGYFDGEELVAIASLYERDSDGYQGRGCQLRSMAVAENKQGQGFGHKLLAGICQKLATDTDYLWANARASAITFYQQADFEINPVVFDIADVGPHQHIVKRFK